MRKARVGRYLEASTQQSNMPSTSYQHAQPSATGKRKRVERRALAQTSSSSDDDAPPPPPRARRAKEPSPSSDDDEQLILRWQKNPPTPDEDERPPPPRARRAKEPSPSSDDDEQLISRWQKDPPTPDEDARPRTSRMPTRKAQRLFSSRETSIIRNATRGLKDSATRDEIASKLKQDKECIAYDLVPGERFTAQQLRDKFKSIRRNK